MHDRYTEDLELDKVMLDGCTSKNRMRGYIPSNLWLMTTMLSMTMGKIGRMEGKRSFTGITVVCHCLEVKLCQY